MAASKFPLEGLKERHFRKLMEAYKDNACLWNSTHSDYRNNEKKDKAFDELLEIFQKKYPTASRANIKTVIGNLRQKYVRLRKRVLEEPRFVPTMWYYHHLSFLNKEVKPRRPRHSGPAPPVVEIPAQEENEEDKYNTALSNLLEFLPFDQKPVARHFISEIAKYAQKRQMGVLKLLMTVGDKDLVLISNSIPIPNSSTSAAFTPKDLDVLDREETERAVRCIQPATDSDDYEDIDNNEPATEQLIEEPAVIELD
ncbi:hypothetical protein PYW07_000606 [Mythimna separata]|uniref:MADF domain-containing protein n=1 Tax=Mythimna separata TaxID=271217 RepID=A0AAD8E1V2_MYTSE|nr:hypothetical protein PYW07_000606 [Mythimna separata]